VPQETKLKNAQGKKAGKKRKGFTPSREGKKKTTWRRGVSRHKGKAHRFSLSGTGENRIATKKKTEADMSKGKGKEKICTFQNEKGKGNTKKPKGGIGE